ncbi:MAG: hypothetical protein ABH886_05060 [Candidatus Desantisbacteria bacterium]
MIAKNNLPKVVFLYGNEPDPTTVRKINLLHNSGQFNVFLIYWHRIASTISYPFSCDLPADNIYEVKLPDPRNSLSCRIVTTLKFLRSVGNFVFQQKPEIIHAVHLDMLIIAYVVRLLLGGKLKIVYDIEDTTEFMIAVPMRKLQRFLCKRVDLIFVTSMRYLTHFLIKFKILDDDYKVMYVPNCPHRKQFSKLRKENHSGFVLGYFGAYREENILQNIITSISLLRKEDYDIKILFAGSGKAQFLVEQFASRYEWVENYGPYDYWDDIVGLYGRVDLILAMYDPREYNKKIHMACRFSEAVVSGLPLLVSKETYMAELVEQYNLGWSVNGFNEKELYLTLRDIVISCNTMYKSIFNAKEIYKEHCFESYEEDILRRYNALLSNKILSTPFSKPNYRVLSVSEKGELWASNGYKVCCSHNYGEDFEFIAKYKTSIIQKVTTQFRSINRILRGGFHDLIILNDSIIGIVPHYIVRAKKGSNQFVSVFHIKRGTRPLSLANTPEGYLYFGEYFNNPNRDEVYIYESRDEGCNWEVCHTFLKSSIRHVHKILYDHYRKGLLVLTGDEGHECKVLFTSDNFQTMDEIISGNQQARAVSAIPIHEGIILPTDTPLEQNYIQFLDNNGKLHQICPIPGSSFYACRAGSYFFISTAVEPSEVNRSCLATLWGSKNGFNWKQIFQAKKDIYPSKLFQYGNIILPCGVNNSSYLFATTVALNGCDGVMHRWDVGELTNDLK